MLNLYKRVLCSVSVKHYYYRTHKILHLATRMAAVFGQVNPFDGEKEEWPQYVERLDCFFVANGITEAVKKRAILLTVVGPATYKLLRNLVAPAKPDEKTYKELVEVVKEHQNPKPAEIVQRFKFNSRARQPGESVSTFVSQLRSLAEFCNYGALLDNMLRDRLVCGVNDSHIQRRLLSERNLTFAKALELAQGLETASKNVQTLQGAVASATAENSVQRINARERLPLRAGVMQSVNTTERGPCSRCGKSNHVSSKCRFKNAKCHNCGRIGHIKAACRSRPRKTMQPRDKQRDVKNLQEEESVPEYTLFSIGDGEGREPLEVDLEVDGLTLRMELDTGASLSLISKSIFKQRWPSESLQPTTIKLKTYSGEPLEVLGSLEVHVRHGVNKAKLPLLVVGGDGPSLLGRNWLKCLRLDWGMIHQLRVGPLEEVLRRHPEVFKDELGTLKGYQAKIYVDPAVKPRFCKARSVPYSMRSLVEDELDRLVQQGIIEPVQFADWAAPIVPVLKSDKKSVRICGDFKMTANQASKLDRYLIPKIEDLFSKLSGGKTFSKLDMSQAYQQLVLDESSRKFVVINTQRGLFQYNRLPYGVSSAPGIFQRTMETLLQGIQSVVVYIDDILITGATEEEHLQALDEVLHRLERAGLRLNKTKCVLMASSVTYLGHRIDQYGLHPLADKVRAVQEAPEPRNVTELKSYLGILSYYSKFLPNLSSTLAPLYQLLCVSARWRWTAKEREAFKASKQLLTSSKVLTHFDPSEELILAGDASPYGIGAVLSHRFADGSEKPIGYASRTLSPAEKNYSQIEKETLACIFAVKRFHSYIYGHPFTLYTDHKPLVSLLNEKRAVPAQACARIQRWALTLAMYGYTVAFKNSSAHSNADALSRLPLPESVPCTPQPPETILLLEHLEEMPVTAEHIKTWTQRDPILSRVLQFVQCGWPSTMEDEQLHTFWTKRLELSSQNGCLLWGNRVIIPAPGQARVLQELHEAHPGATRMKRLARMFVWWPGLNHDVEEEVRSCSECQSNQPSPPLSPLQPWSWPTRPWSRVHIDYMGPFMGRMFLVLIDSHSKWIEVHLMSSTTSSATIQCLRSIFATFGLPEVLVSDNGPNFVSAEFEDFLLKNGVKHTTSAPYHPASNGLAERAVQTVKKGLKKMKTGSIQDKISRFLFSYRNTPQTTTGVALLTCLWSEGYDHLWICSSLIYTSG